MDAIRRNWSDARARDEHKRYTRTDRQKQIARDVARKSIAKQKRDYKRQVEFIREEARIKQIIKRDAATLAALRESGKYTAPLEKIMEKNTKAALTRLQNDRRDERQARRTEQLAVTMGLSEPELEAMTCGNLPPDYL